MWKSDAEVKVFRGSGAHKKAMRNLPNWCDEAACAHWLQEGNALPAWGILHERLLDEGRLSKVRYPSIQQGDDGIFAAKVDKNRA